MWVKMEIFQGVSDVILQVLLLQSAHIEPLNASQRILMRSILLFLNQLKIEETLGRGVLDSGCFKTVSGELWMEQYLSALPEEWRETVKTSNNTNVAYHFGDRKK